MTNLPKHRVNLIRPYLNTGIDFTGHIYVKEGGTEKRFYMLVFTCLNIRACHIELVPDMNADQFILAFIRFVNEYGVPANVYSDNGRSFISGLNIIKDFFL